MSVDGDSAISSERPEVSPCNVVDSFPTHETLRNGCFDYKLAEMTSTFTIKDGPKFAEDCGEDRILGLERAKPTDISHRGFNSFHTKLIFLSQ